jgi:hypothetical protein
MTGMSAEDVLQGATLRLARRGQLVPGVPFSAEAVANAFVMLGLVPEQRVEEMLSRRRTALEAEGFKFGVLTGEMSVRPGAYGFQAASGDGPDTLNAVPLTMAAGPLHIRLGSADVTFEWVTVTPAGIRLHLRAITNTDDGRSPNLLGDLIAETLRITDDTGHGHEVTNRGYRMRFTVRAARSLSFGKGTLPGSRRMVHWSGEIVAEPADGDRLGPIGSLEFAGPEGEALTVQLSRPEAVPTGTAEPRWPTPAEAYLAELSQVTKCSIGTGDDSVELDTARIIAAVADALLAAGALPTGSALLYGEGSRERPAWQRELSILWGRRRTHATWPRADGTSVEPSRAALAARLPLQQATVVIESVTASEDYVSIRIYGHPWVTGEYWPMITPCFGVRAVDEDGRDYEGTPGMSGGSPEGRGEFVFWPPVPASVKRLRVTVSTLWESAWADIQIPGR